MSEEKVGAEGAAREISIPDGHVCIPEKMFWDLMAGNNKPYVLAMRFREMVKRSEKIDENQT